MVSMSEVKASNGRISEGTLPSTIVFTGATDGIGKAALTRLVSARLPLKAYVIGRNGPKHKPFLDQLRKTNDKANIIWLEGQVSLLADTKRLCDIIKENEKSIDALYTSPGAFPSGERIETSEGLIMTLAMSFYHRISMMIQLLPLLKASSNNPRIVNILAAGTESSSIFLDDLDLEQPEHFGLLNSSRAAATYTTLSMSRLAKENPHVAFIHHYPGGVNTDLFRKAYQDKWFWGVLGTMLAVAGTTPDDAGEKVVYMLTSAKYGGKGVALGTKESSGQTMAKTTHGGSLFLVNDKLQELQQEKVMTALGKMNAESVVWQKLQDTIRPYC